MENTAKSIPIQTFKRLPKYYSLLTKLQNEGMENISSTTLAGMFKLNDVVVRKDLAAVTENGGKPRTGYAVDDLIHQIGQRLGYHNVNDAVLVGAGQLGRALLSYGGFAKYGLRILAAFDIDGKKACSEKASVKILDISELPRFCKRLNIQIGIITVPEKAAQEVCDMLILSGIKAIWNFAPAYLTVPENIFVHSEDMALSLSLLSQHLSDTNHEETP